VAALLGFSASVSAVKVYDIAEDYPDPVALTGQSLACDLPEHAFLYQEGYLIAQKAGVEKAWYKTMFSELMDTNKCCISPQEAQMVTAKTLVGFDNPIKAPMSVMFFVGVLCRPLAQPGVDLEVRTKHFTLGGQQANLAQAVGEVLGVAVAQIVTNDGGNHHVLQTQVAMATARFIGSSAFGPLLTASTPMAFVR
jgi:hypothetical protein